MIGLVLVAAAATTCDRPAPEPGPAAPIVVTDDAGRTVELPSPAQRVVSLIPSMTDVVIAIGASDRLVARTRYDTDPRIADLPSLEDALTPSVEWLIQREADLVIAWPDRQSRTVVTRLAELGVPVYTSTIETLDDMRRGVEHLGTLLGLRASTDSLVGALDAAISDVREAVADRPVVDVVYLIGLDPPVAAGTGSFIDELISIAGGHNVLADAPSAWPPVSVEEIVARRPDVLLIAVPESGEEVHRRLLTMPGLRRLDAVRQGRVRVLDASQFNRPGPGLIEAVRVLARAIHPGAMTP